ncbi:hypothetical protein ESA94_13395 [Lacibacter luteus]|uniref:Uncharacterized protein n=1 Tax=Lacibacter luteus TaxID=2508719 RepID=A0A4Q1CI55_9BACT|nr:hypothetical protein [Lacibacter luteus]RXK60036.1 hypothetical protein ESA94_13395 [Lacibacter luteus]
MEPDEVKSNLAEELPASDQPLNGSGDERPATVEEVQPADSNATFHNTGDDAVLIDDTEIDELTINKAGRDNNITQHTNVFKSPKEQRFSCPYCDVESEIKKYGKHKCKNCERTFIIKSERNKDILLYKTLLPEEARKFDKLLAHINNNLRDKSYEAAYDYCKKAEELAPGEVATWEKFAITEFLLEIKKVGGKRKPTAEIIRSVRNHIDKCKDHGMTEEEYEPLVVDIANWLFNIERQRINSVQASTRDSTNSPKWSRSNFVYLQNLLDSFEICYLLYNDTLFLEGYVNELAKEYKWIIKTSDGKLINNPACAPFNAVKKMESLVEKIKVKKKYNAPDIAEERFLIKKAHHLNIISVTQKST